MDSDISFVLNNPFNSAAGVLPSVFIGRKDEQSFFRKHLLRAAHKLPAKEVVIFGPRGNGKTALLEQVRCSDADYDKVIISSDGIESSGHLAMRIARAEFDGHDDGAWGGDRALAPPDASSTP